MNVKDNAKVEFADMKILELIGSHATGAVSLALMAVDGESVGESILRLSGEGRSLEDKDVQRLLDAFRAKFSRMDKES